MWVFLLGGLVKIFLFTYFKKFIHKSEVLLFYKKILLKDVFFPSVSTHFGMESNLSFCLRLYHFLLPFFLFLKIDAKEKNFVTCTYFLPFQKVP